MLFNSFEYLIFLPIVFTLYWSVFGKWKNGQNFIILLASYVFYGWWDYRFLLLIFISTVVDYFTGILISRQTQIIKKKVLLMTSIFFNLGVLVFFKYYNFFIDSWLQLFESIGYKVNSVWTLSIVLPVGISFYTFQTMSYTVDIYKNKLYPTKDFISFASFVSFFPQLVAGPIERGKNLLPQILSKRNFSYEQAVQGVRLIIWGMYKKVIVADSLAPIVEDIFANYPGYNGGVLFLGIIYFAFQIYCDFSGYSDIAIGTAKLFGVELMTNFKFPYFARNIAEFWRKWHISLSSWFRDYVYIPIGGSKEGKVKTIRNIFIVFILSGLWHGANWTFVFWGLYHAILFLPLFVLERNRKYIDSGLADLSALPKLLDIIKVVFTFVLVAFGWVFFRSENLSESFGYLSRMISGFDSPDLYRRAAIYIIMPFVLFEYLLRHYPRLGFNIYKWKFIQSVIMAILVVYIIIHFGRGNVDFIYFQF